MTSYAVSHPYTPWTVIIGTQSAIVTIAGQTWPFEGYRLAGPRSTIISDTVRPGTWKNPVLRRRVIGGARSEEHTSELQSRGHLVCRLLLEKKKQVFLHH